MSEAEIFAKPDHRPKTLDKYNEPKIKLDFYFAGHGDKHDAEEFLRRVATADFIAIEGIGWTERNRKFLQDIMDGSISRDKILTVKAQGFSEYLREAYEGLYDSHKALFVIDIPEGSLEKKHHRLIEQFEHIQQEAYVDFLSGNFNEVLRLVQQASDIFYTATAEREKAIVHNLHNKIGDRKKLFKQFPQLKERLELRGVVSFGSTHTNIYHDYRKKYDDFSGDQLSLLVGPFAFVPSREIYRRKRVGMAVDQTLFAQMALEYLVMMLLIKITSSPQLLTDGMAFFSRKFDFDEIKEISSKIAANHDPREARKRIFAEALEKKGLKFPATEDELSQMLPKWKLE